jgi:hypothetical protein
MLFGGNMKTLEPIKTYYKGYRFRSRLEARWAVFFDTLGIDWEYEKDGYDLDDLGWYLPDFWLPYTESYKGIFKYPDSGEWVEIKPFIRGKDPELIGIQKLDALSKGTKHSGNMMFGLPAEHYYIHTHHSSEWNWTFPGEKVVDLGGYPLPGENLDFSEDIKFALYGLMVKFGDNICNTFDSAILSAKQYDF